MLGIWEGMQALTTKAQLTQAAKRLLALHKEFSKKANALPRAG